MAEGYSRFKVKVGTGIEEDRKRLKIIREEIGNDNILMVDANQKWNVTEAIETMKQLADFDLFWIEEPTSNFSTPIFYFLFLFTIGQVQMISWDMLE